MQISKPYVALIFFAVGMVAMFLFMNYHNNGIVNKTTLDIQHQADIADFAKQKTVLSDSIEVIWKDSIKYIKSEITALNAKEPLIITKYVVIHDIAKKEPVKYADSWMPDSIFYEGSLVNITKRDLDSCNSEHINNQQNKSLLTHSDSINVELVLLTHADSIALNAADSSKAALKSVNIAQSAIIGDLNKLLKQQKTKTFLQKLETRVLEGTLIVVAVAHYVFHSF